ncbi:hypothetical protein MMC11_002755 [Xylographa trunciseda]|nr:hypothetical protein [Xylographa trunciseda]
MAYRRIKEVFKVDLPQHKRAHIDDTAQDVLEVIGAGLPRSGTTSLKAALEILGFDPCHHMSELFDHPGKSAEWASFLIASPEQSSEESEQRMQKIRLAMRGYRATVDSPGCDVYQDLVKLYPKAKVVLSVRDSDEAWWKSFTSSMGAQTKKRYAWLTYPIPFLRENMVLFRVLANRWTRLAGMNSLGPAVHGAHNQDVQSNVPPERLLVFNMNMGWAPLCEFLGVQVPDQPFPNMNDAKTIARLVLGAQLMGACVWLLYLGLTGFMIFIAFNYGGITMAWTGLRQ